MCSKLGEGLRASGLEVRRFQEPNPQEERLTCGAGREAGRLSHTHYEKDMPNYCPAVSTWIMRPGEH